MSQYEAARYIFDSDGGVTADEVKKELGIVESSCRTSLLKLQKKNIIEQRGDQYHPHSNATEEDLERIRPRTINELRDE